MILPQSEDKLATKQDLAQAKLDIIKWGWDYLLLLPL